MIEYPTVAELINEGCFIGYAPTATDQSGYYTDDMVSIAYTERVPVTACWFMQQEPLIMEVRAQ